MEIGLPVHCALCNLLHTHRKRRRKEIMKWHTQKDVLFESMVQTVLFFKQKALWIGLCTVSFLRAAIQEQMRVYFTFGIFHIWNQLCHCFTSSPPKKNANPFIIGYLVQIFAPYFRTVLIFRSLIVAGALYSLFICPWFNEQCLLDISCIV